MTDEFTHLDAEGRVRMVDVTEKAPSLREATARGRITMTGDTLARIGKNDVKKGNVLETARIAGIMAAKKTAEWIPMCHPLAITHAQVDFDLLPEVRAIDITAVVRLRGSTGVEMEALTAVSVAALTIYDMCKSYDREMIIGDIRLMEKAGGKSGHYRRSP
jgi:cyclic pyranopterin phosphate synthase